MVDGNSAGFKLSADKILFVRIEADIVVNGEKQITLVGAAPEKLFIA
jgi:hypothetical protein